MARPRTFEREDALHRAAEVFWAQGYEATSIDDLVRATGLVRQSIYNTFGNKHAFYLEALAHYQDLLGARMLTALKRAPNVKEGFQRLFDLVIQDAVTQTTRRGCMMVNAATERAARDPAVCKLTTTAEREKEQLFAQLIREAQTRGELAADKDPDMLAKFLYNTVLGLRVRATRNPAQKDLEPIVRAALSLLE